MAKEKKDKPLKIEEKIKKCKDEITANAKDPAWMKKQLVHLTSLQKQADVEAVELVVPCKEIKETIDFDAYTLKRTIRGILFTAKGGMSTFVELRMQSVYEMLDKVFYLYNNPPEDEETKQYADAFMNAVPYIMQAPIFASLGETMLFDIAANMLRGFNEYVTANVDNATLKDETEDDIKANIEADNMAKVLDDIAKTEIPKVD